jgi:hypothetical protein
MRKIPTFAAFTLVFALVFMLGACDDNTYVHIEPSTPIPPTIPIPPTTGVPTLTENIWKEGNITAAGGVEWFTFTATAVTQYIHFDPGTMDDVYVQLYNTDGTKTGGQSNLYNSSNSLLYTSRALTIGEAYFIWVKPYRNSGSGNYKIAFNTYNAPPTISVPDPARITPLVEDTPANGDIISSGSTQWFSFTASTGVHFIHFKPGNGNPQGDLKDVYVQVCDTSGNTIKGRTRLYDATLSTARPLTIDTEYYIKVTPYTGKGAFSIAFNTTPWPLDVTGTTLAKDTWASGAIVAASGDNPAITEQWFIFTAENSPQYIYFKSGSLKNVYISLYDNTGTLAANVNSQSGLTFSFSIEVETGTIYYIKVTPYSNNLHGDFKMAFSETGGEPEDD